LLAIAIFAAIGVWLVRAAPTPNSTNATSQIASPLSPEQERALKPKDIFQECINYPEMIVVPAGSFKMGSPLDELSRFNNEGPQHDVTFADQFAVGRFALTFDEWDACADDGGCSGYRPNDNGWGRGRQPVIYVSRNHADAYVAWLSKKTGKDYRLLSDAEREYVKRAGTATPFWWGSSISTDQANYDGTTIYGNGAQGEYRGRTMPVQSFQANSWGLYQVHGNVWEWVEDCWHDAYYQGVPRDGTAWKTGDCTHSVMRGGSWHSPASNLRSATRFTAPNEDRLINLGFRVARTLATR
jgi:formylglycine-generating enzyme required for sulfatase activity